MCHSPDGTADGSVIFRRACRPNFCNGGSSGTPGAETGEGMAYFALFYDVVDDFAARRSPFRAEHLRLAQEAHRRGELVLAGAVGAPPDRALLVFRTEDPSIVDAFARADPYVTRGLVTNWEVQPWAVVVGNESMLSLGG